MCYSKKNKRTSSASDTESPLSKKPRVSSEIATSNLRSPTAASSSQMLGKVVPKSTDGYIKNVLEKKPVEITSPDPIAETIATLNCDRKVDTEITVDAEQDKDHLSHHASRGSEQCPPVDSADRLYSGHYDEQMDDSFGIDSFIFETEYDDEISFHTLPSIINFSVNIGELGPSSSLLPTKVPEEIPLPLSSSSDQHSGLNDCILDGGFLDKLDQPMEDFPKLSHSGPTLDKALGKKNSIDSNSISGDLEPVDNSSCPTSKQIIVSPPHMIKPSEPLPHVENIPPCNFQSNDPSGKPSKKKASPTKKACKEKKAYTPKKAVLPKKSNTKKPSCHPPSSVVTKPPTQKFRDCLTALPASYGRRVSKSDLVEKPNTQYPKFPKRKWS